MDYVMTNKVIFDYVFDALIKILNLPNVSVCNQRIKLFCLDREILFRF